ncbi:MAG: GNAT family N-acetyltransferase [Candidatus Moraniibacteriota bacterium]
MKKIANCYRSVFADPPWNEWLRCPTCSKYWGISEWKQLRSSNYKHCGNQVEEFWPQQKVISDIKLELTSDSSCWIANNSKVIGFCWGYETDINHLEKKLEIELQNVMSHKFGMLGPIAYQDEIGVLSRYRGQGIAKEMFIRRLKDFLARGLDIGIVRTRFEPEPSITYLWYKHLGYEIIAKYPDGRVVLARNLKFLNKLFM